MSDFRQHCSSSRSTGLPCFSLDTSEHRNPGGDDEPDHGGSCGETGPASTSEYKESAKLGDKDGWSKRRHDVAAVYSAGSSMENDTHGTTPTSPQAEAGETMKAQDLDVQDFCLDFELENSPVLNQNIAGGEGAGVHARGSIALGLDVTRNGAAVETTSQTSLRCTSCAHGVAIAIAIAITESQASGLRELVFGERSKTFNDAWREQAFYFCGKEGLAYGLVQRCGGPCGVVAAVQAFLLEDLLFRRHAESDWRKAKRWKRERSLASALTTIIWRAGDGISAFLAISDGEPTVQRSSRYRPDGVTERLKLYRALSWNAMEALVYENFHHFTARKGHGVILLVYSCLLSRGIHLVRDDMDNSFGEPGSLIDRHGYASQELVNLLLLGRAHSNVFDGQRVIDGEGDRAKKPAHDKGFSENNERVVLTGVPTRGRVGFLTLFEAYKYVEVGNNFKTPEAPVWVVCSESHYSVLFSTDKSLISSPSRLAKRGTTKGDTDEVCAGAEPCGNLGGENTLESARKGGHANDREGSCSGMAPQAFDLEYYDGLARQDEVIRLTVHWTNRPTPLTAEDSENGALVPPLDLVVRTRWPGATVDWNGTEPLL